MFCVDHVKQINLQFFSFCRFLKNYVENIFAGAWDKCETAPISPQIPLPPPLEGNFYFHINFCLVYWSYLRYYH